MKALVDLQVDNGLGGDRIAKLEAFRKRGPVEHLLGQPEHLEHPEHVGSKLDTGADLLELGRLLQHLHRDALARQRQRRGQPPDAAAHDQNGWPIFVCTHQSSLISSISSDRRLKEQTASDRPMAVGKT